MLFQAVWAATVLLIEVPSSILADRFGWKSLLLIDRPGPDTAFVTSGVRFAALSLPTYLLWVASADTNCDPANPRTKNELSVLNSPLADVNTLEVADAEVDP